MALARLGNVSVDTFLRDYWQRQPLLIRQVFSDFQSPVSADEIAGLSLEDWVESRLVWERGSQHPWQVEHGPFSEAQLTRLPRQGWSLLVQGVDALLPDVGALLNEFRFLPDWRLDDIMVSVAPDGGSVGAHFDYYDVFLLQAAGRRRWKLGEFCDQHSALLPDCDLRILRDFHARQEWLLEPGDMLYVPPRLAHWGIAEGESLTFSIGFRAPSVAELVAEYAQDRAEQLPLLHYRDPDGLVPDHGNAISAQVVEQLQTLLHNNLMDPVKIADWFGRHMTESRYGSFQSATGIDAPLTEASISTLTLRQRDDSRTAFYALGNGEAILFINGQRWRVAEVFAGLLASHEPIAGKRLAKLLTDPRNREALADILAKGWLEPAEIAP